MPPTDMAVQEKLRTFESPTWGYRLTKDGTVEKDLFDGVLPDGWYDSPAAVHGKPKKGKTQEPAPMADAGTREPQSVLEPPYDRFGFPALTQELKRRTGKGARPGTKPSDIIVRLEELDAAG